MLTKLSSDVLDKLDIFVLELEELFVPKVCLIDQLTYIHLLVLKTFLKFLHLCPQPLFWEWLWLLSFPVTFFGLSATKVPNLPAVKKFLIGTMVSRNCHEESSS